MGQPFFTVVLAKGFLCFLCILGDQAKCPALRSICLLRAFKSRFIIGYENMRKEPITPINQGLKALFRFLNGY